MDDLPALLRRQHGLASRDQLTGGAGGSAAQLTVMVAAMAHLGRRRAATTHCWRRR